MNEVGRDPGLQFERTTLAWSRSAFALLANGALILRIGAVGHTRAIEIVGLLVIGAAAALFAFSWQRHRARTSPRQATPCLLVAGTAALAVSAGVAGLTAVIADAMR
jgi:uncharacterized membrane protein YidH (DUF202 family)